MYLSLLNVIITDIHSCTDFGTHFNSHVEQDVEWMQHIDRAVHVFMKLCKENGADMGS